MPNNIPLHWRRTPNNKRTVLPKLAIPIWSTLSVWEVRRRLPILLVAAIPGPVALISYPWLWLSRVNTPNSSMYRCRSRDTTMDLTVSPVLPVPMPKTTHCYKSGTQSLRCPRKIHQAHLAFPLWDLHHRRRKAMGREDH